MTTSPTIQDERATTIAANVTAVRARIAAAANRAGRDPASVTLIAVTKTFPPEVAAAVVAAGAPDLGENRVQEGVVKAEALAVNGLTPRWHLIGHLQSNKVKAALPVFAMIHGVDSEALAQAISRRAESPVPILLEVNVGGEATKFGFHPDDLLTAVARVRALPNIDLRGLMTVAPPASDPSDVRPVFRRLRELAAAAELPELSMGMTDDFEVAIEEGATMVRVGRALFGARPVPGAPS